MRLTRTGRDCRARRDRAHTRPMGEHEIDFSPPWQRIRCATQSPSSRASTTTLSRYRNLRDAAAKAAATEACESGKS